MNIERLLNYCDKIESDSEKIFSGGDDYLLGYKNALKHVREYCELMEKVKF